MRTGAAVGFAALALAGGAGCRPEDVGPDTGGGERALTAGETVLAYDERGWVDIHTSGGEPVLLRAMGVATLGATDATGVRVRTDAARAHEVEERWEQDALGVAHRLVVVVPGADGEPELRWTISAYDAGGFYTFALAVRDDSGSGESPALAVAKLSPVLVDAVDGGALYLGADPARHRILENGSYAVLDFVAQVQPGDVPRDEGYASIAPGDFAGYSVSDWNHAVADLDGGPGWVAGALSTRASVPVTELSYEPQLAPTDAAGRRGFTFFAVESAYQPLPRPIPAGGTFTSELAYVHPLVDDVPRGLEAYAQTLADALGVVPWHRREEGRRVPNGWNSWSGSGGTGGYGTAIDEAIVLENLDVMATELRDWGIDWFQVDDGYEPHYGDWLEWNAERFPHGPAWLAQQIRDAGFVPGLWMAPFTASPDSQLVADHPDWFADKTPLGTIFVAETEILDLTHPEAQAWLQGLFHTFRREWGFDWLKLDFGYYALFGTGFDDPAATREEAWRAGMGAVRDGLGDDAFLLGIGAVGINYDLCEAFRTTLDNAPVWDGDPGVPLDDLLQQQGFKPTVRTAGRRWFLQDRVWINHPDLLFFRSNTVDASWPPLTFDESVAFASFVGLSGGIVKLGDRLVDLDGDAIDVIRRLLPIHGAAARPLDVFTREFPEVWQLDVVDPLDGYDEGYQVLGLFDWGSNRDLSVTPYADLADDGVGSVHHVCLDAVGIERDALAWEFWTGTFLGVVEDCLDVSVPSHAARVVALRERTGVPQFLGWNRQITMGGTLLEEAAWSEVSRTFTARFPVVPGTDAAPFTWRLAVYLPDAYVAALPDPAGALTVTGAAVRDVHGALEGNVYLVTFVAAERGEARVELRLD